ncbi:PucR family transcriptional regulator [Nocardia sp. NPDC058499]|uniref:PucR family transcriptional regulator n=1 Tax=Nocardia sp. NPDC058499 TaxID=3346530 RepID=UPI00365C38AA
MAAAVLDRGERSAHPEIAAPHIVSSALARTGVNGHRTLAVVRDTDIVAVAGLGRATAGALCTRLRRTRDTLLAEGITTAFGISTVITGIEQLPRGRQEAHTALDLLPDSGGVLALPELTPFRYLVLSSDDTARSLVDPRIARALADDQAKGGVLAETIRAFIAADTNLREAADALRIHHNTAKYRLRRIQQLTGRNIRTVTDLVELLVALELRQAPAAVRRER